MAGNSNFVTEIKKIMYVCGDCVNPSTESAALVEEIMQQQIVQLAVKAMEHARGRSGDTVAEVALTVEDIFFLMRRDKNKLKRVLYQIDFKALARRTSSASDDRTMDAEAGVGGEDGGRGVRRHPLDADFLTDMFGSDFYTTQEAVQLQQEKMTRHDFRTRGMDSAEYLNYVECRRVSFVKNMVRFRKWLNLESVIDHKVAHDVMEVLGYLAYDTVRELVELSLLVKEDTNRSHRDVISSHHFILPSSHPPMGSPSSHPHTHSTSSHPHTSPPPPSPPNQPTSPSAGASLEASSEPLATPAKNPRGRKRKRSVAVDVATTSGRHDSISEQPQGSGPGPEPSQNGMETDKSGRGIQPSHIREAMRRLSVPSGPLLPLTTYHSRTSFTQKTLCL